MRTGCCNLAETKRFPWISFFFFFLTFQLSKHFDCSVTRAAEIAGIVIGRSDRVVRELRSQLFENGGCIPESEQAMYERSGVV